jgi:pyruvate dehydrogenase E1 component alpha subunit
MGAGRARDGVRLTPKTALRMATATAQPAKDETLLELQRRMLRQMLLVRRFEEKAAEAYALGKVGGFCHLYIGQEAVAAGSLAALRDDDYVICSYREHGQALVRGVPANAVMAELFGKATGCSRGKGGSMHLFDAGRRFMGGHGIVGGHIPLAVGLGFAIKYRGGDQVCLCYFGEAAVNIGAFHEALNMASVWKLPIIFCCENNRYGMGTAFERVAAVTDVVEHACSYDMAAELVNGMDAMAVYGATERAAERARKTGHPTLLEVRTYRFMGHSMSDPLHGVYRTKEEVEEQKKRDPISQLALKLKEEGALDDAALDALDAEVRAVVEAAVQFADQSPDPDLAELTSHVLVE